MFFFFKLLVFAAEHTTSRCSSLFLVRCLVGSRRPEEQQAEPAVRQPVEPQPQTWLLWDQDVGEFTCRHTASPFKPLLWWCLIIKAHLYFRFGLWSASNTRPSSMTWPTWQTSSRDWLCSPAPEPQPRVKNMWPQQRWKEKNALLCFRKHLYTVNICHHLLKCVTKPLTKNRNTGTKQARNHYCLQCSSCV